MSYPVESCDLLQQAFATRGLNDHTLHARLTFDSTPGIDPEILRRALAATLVAIPVLGSRLDEAGRRPQWCEARSEDGGPALRVVADPDEREALFLQSLDPATAPQVRLLLSGDGRELGVMMNHMVTDGGGLKEYLSFLAATYSGLCADPAFVPRPITGGRGLGRILRAVPPLRRVAALLGPSHRGDSRVRRAQLGFSAGPGTAFLATRTLSVETVDRIRTACHGRGATLNDALLAGLYRVVATQLGARGEAELVIPIMVDMRRYLPGMTFDTLANLASTVPTTLRFDPDETYATTLLSVRDVTVALKRTDLGVGSLAKLDALFRVAGPRLGRKILELGLDWPNLCMTNLGRLDPARLSFGASRPTAAFACGAIKARPHFQLAVSEYAGGLTLSAGLIGADGDRELVDRILAGVADQMVQFADGPIGVGSAPRG